MEKAAEKRKRREDRKLGIDGSEEPDGSDGPGVANVLDPNDPYALANYFAREAE